MSENNTVQGEYLMYNNRPLVRQDDTICYGDMSDKYVLVLEIISYAEVNGNRLPNKIITQIIDSKNPNNIARQGVFNGLQEAFGTGVEWLEIALK